MTTHTVALAEALGLQRPFRHGQELQVVVVVLQHHAHVARWQHQLLKGVVEGAEEGAEGTLHN